MIHIVDYGMGNLGSIFNMFKRIGVDAKITNDVNEIKNASKLILPGVGSFDAAMSAINKGNLRKVLDDKVLSEKTPILGICLGMQLMTEGSEEGSLPGLGWIAAQTCKLEARGDLKVPHMGWNIACSVGENHLIDNVGEEQRFYFVHSYCVKVKDEANALMKTEHGTLFDSAIHSGHIYGVQFHPEKSHKYGLRLLTNFARLSC
ncbi:MAG: imidazole glycerol phosphate synthase subunit HisH [Legionellaceae bacterium]|nr:imidazole glycerol phosphate synthase subunit HisH [Legionellaceae bacterium]